MLDPSIQILLWLLAALLIVLGFAGLILPALPGIPLVFAGLVLLAWAENFAYVGWVTLILLAGLALLSYGIDFLAAASLGAKKFGASPRAIAGAALGTLAGLFFGLPGIVLGPFVGAVIGEFSREGGDTGGCWGNAGLAVRRLAENCPGFRHVGRVRAGPSALGRLPAGEEAGGQFAASLPLGAVEHLQNPLAGNRFAMGLRVSKVVVSVRYLKKGRAKCPLPDFRRAIGNLGSSDH